MIQKYIQYFDVIMEMKGYHLKSQEVWAVVDCTLCYFTDLFSWYLSGGWSEALTNE